MFRLSLLVAFFLFSKSGLWAAAPIAYSGKVSIYNSNYHGYAKLTFSLYDSNNTVVWRNGAGADDSIRVFVANGRYTVLLGGQGMNQIPSQLLQKVLIFLLNNNSNLIRWIICNPLKCVATAQTQSK